MMHDMSQKKNKREFERGTHNLLLLRNLLRRSLLLLRRKA